MLHLELTEQEADSVVGALRYAVRLNHLAHWPLEDLTNFAAVMDRIGRLPESPSPLRGERDDVGREAATDASWQREHLGGHLGC